MSEHSPVKPFMRDLRRWTLELLLVQDRAMFCSGDSSDSPTTGLAVREDPWLTMTQAQFWPVHPPIRLKLVDSDGTPAALLVGASIETFPVQEHKPYLTKSNSSRIEQKPKTNYTYRHGRRRK